MVLYGAAYQTLHPRLDPDGCRTTAHRELMLEIGRDVAAWCETQPADVREAYIRALRDITAHAEKVLENNLRAQQMAAARETLPVPPCLDEPHKVP